MLSKSFEKLPLFLIPNFIIELNQIFISFPKINLTLLALKILNYEILEDNETNYLFWKN